ncbi:MAG: hypothetical protein GY851_22435 [bacterium]|nr:hypothetical protein [bacterium]
MPVRAAHSALLSLTLAVALLLAPGCARVTQEDGLLRFSATGDGPRSDEDWGILKAQLVAEADAPRSEFLLHLGDIWHGAEVLPESHYVRVAECLKQSSVPVVIVPGDNEWNDLDDPDAGWTYWTRHLLRLEEHWTDGPRPAHQPARPENVAWVSKGVLMIGLNVVGGTVHDDAEWQLRHRQCAEWVESNLSKHRDDVHAAVVFAQARLQAKHRDFAKPFGESAKRFGKPLLYIHGDGHRWQHEEHWLSENMTRVQVDQVSLNRPVQVTVTRDSAEPFLFDRRLAP